MYNLSYQPNGGVKKATELVSLELKEENPGLNSGKVVEGFLVLGCACERDLCLF